jgi:hypothetical protein
VLSLTGERVYRLHLLLFLASAVILESESRGTIFYSLRFETHPTWRARSPYLYPPGTGWPSYTPRHWVSFSSPPTTRRYSNPPPDSLYSLRIDYIEDPVLLLGQEYHTQDTPRDSKLVLLKCDVSGPFPAPVAGHAEKTAFFTGAC